MLAGVLTARAVVAVGLVLVALVGSARVATVTREQARVPWENNQFVANVAKATGLTYVVTDSTHPGALYYYLGREARVRCCTRPRSRTSRTAP